MQKPDQQRQIRSYVLREGRITAGQKRALELLWPKFGIENHAHITNLNTLFVAPKPKTIVLEIGFGMGESLAQMAQESPQTHFIGIEVHRPGVGSLLAEIESRNLTNLRVMCGDAVEILKTVLPDNTFDRIQIFFPDPWHKTRHNKRRLVQKDFLENLTKKFTINGILHIATDWEDYARHMKAALDSSPAYKNTAPDNNYSERPDYRPTTKFERRGHSLGHGVWDLIYQLQDIKEKPIL